MPWRYFGARKPLETVGDESILQILSSKSSNSKIELDCEEKLGRYAGWGKNFPGGEDQKNAEEAIDQSECFSIYYTQISYRR